MSIETPTNNKDRSPTEIEHIALNVLEKAISTGHLNLRMRLARQQVQTLLDALECLWSEHFIGNKEKTDDLREIATMLRKEYHIPKNEFEEF